MRGKSMNSKTPWIARIALIAFCAVIALTCIFKMNESYDPLARYPYADASNRDTILKYLSDDDIDYIVTQKIKPEQFMDFIELEDFKIHNTLLYSMAKKIQDQSPEYILNFINKYRDRFTYGAWKLAISHYSYEDLVTFFETEEDVRLVLDPENPYVILDENHSIYKYVPNHLVDYEDIVVQKAMVKNLQEMQVDYQSIMNGLDRLTLIEGYTSYEDIMNTHVNLQNEIGQESEMFSYPAGHDERQLGYTIVLEEAKEWNRLCVQEKVYEDFNYEQVYAQLSVEYMNKLNWIRNNAHQYGFVVRYLDGKEEETHQEYQPFVLRYVGVNTAKKMFESNKVLEQMKGLKELK